MFTSNELKSYTRWKGKSLGNTLRSLPSGAPKYLTHTTGKLELSVSSLLTFSHIYQLFLRDDSSKLMSPFTSWGSFWLQAQCAHDRRGCSFKMNNKYNYLYFPPFLALFKSLEARGGEKSSLSQTKSLSSSPHNDKTTQRKPFPFIAFTDYKTYLTYSCTC